MSGSGCAKGCLMIKIRQLSWAVVMGCVMMLGTGCAGLAVKSGKPSQEMVRVVRKGRSWYFQKDGERFLVRGVCCVLPRDAAVKPGAQGYNVLPRYQADTRRWAFEAICRLQAWNFNTVSAWSAPELYSATDLYHTIVLNLAAGDPRWHNRLVDVFSPTYAEAVRRTTRKEVSRHRSDPMLVGYFLNNELPWYGRYGWPGEPEDGLLKRYLALPASAPGKKEAVRFVRNYYGDSFDHFRQQWRCSASSFDELLQCTDSAPQTAEAIVADREWAGVVAERYFALTSEAVREIDPHHLILGARFAGRAPWPVVRACARYCDVISINHYRKSGLPDFTFLDTVYHLTGRPILISEFSWRAQENSSGCPNTMGADVTVQTQKDRAAAYEKFVTELVKRPYIVGYEWFQYFDESPQGRSFDGENSNYGLVDIHDAPYPELLQTARRVNALSTRLHRHPVAPGPAHPEHIQDFVSASLPDLPPLSQPINWTDGRRWQAAAWGDINRGAALKCAVSNDELCIWGHTGSGWGAGVSVRAPTASKETLMRFVGARTASIRLACREPIRFRFFINETGHGPPEATSFAGINGADGEAYQSLLRIAPGGEALYRVSFADMVRNPAYGNQNGNARIDTGGIAEVGLLFPPGQEIDLKLKEIRLE